MNALAALSEMTVDEYFDRMAEAVVAKVQALGLTATKEEGPLTADVLAGKLGISKRTLFDRVDRGEFPAPAFGGGHGQKKVWLPSQINLS